MTNHPSTYRYPLYVLTDDDYNALGAVTITDTGRYIGHDTAGRELFNRKDSAGCLRASKQHGHSVSSAWYGVGTGRPRDHKEN